MAKKKSTNRYPLQKVAEKKRQKKRDSERFRQSLPMYQSYEANTFSDLVDNVVTGDCLDVMNLIPNNKVNLIITSPPYFQQRDYGGGIGNEKTIDLYLENLLAVFDQCNRVLTEDGSVVFNLGDKYLNSSLQLIPYRFALRVLETFQVKLVNDITWIKLNPTPRQYQKRLVNSTEPFFHFVKSDKYYYQLNEFKKNDSLKNKKNDGSNIGKKYYELIRTSSLTSEQKRAAIQELTDTIREVKEGKIESLRMKIQGIHSEPFGGQNGGRMYHLMRKGFTIIKIKGNGIKKDVMESAVETIKGSKHPAVYPLSIIRELIKLLSRPGDFVLDPFVGSGTTAIAAKELNRSYIGIDLNQEYCKYARERLSRIHYQETPEILNEI